MTLKVRTEAGVFGADRMRPINLNLRYLAVKETLLAEIRGVFFYCLFCFVFPVSLHFSSSHHTVCLTVWRCAAISSFFKLMKKTLEREHLLTAHPKVCGRRKKEWHRTFLWNFKWGSCGKYRCMLNFLISTLSVSLSLVYKQMRGDFLQEMMDSRLVVENRKEYC